jgi:hypothetical protein
LRALIENAGKAADNADALRAALEAALHATFITMFVVALMVAAVTLLIPKIKLKPRAR